ncbi:nucleotide exchange factor GrpE [Candidatus Allofournierella merdipullorum]|uniref:nucleotide exchange factor GrpE n=1 Tax=Candidatus Allofournierella merdipullorum TaxID=2838595 RepID=UPI002A87A23C|nr:nucleotide exchange factor GrpE [Candidatus Fournierella merdipullorum]
MMDEANIRPEEAAETTTPEAETAPKAEKAPAKEKKETKKDLEAQLAAAKAEAEKARAEADEAKDRLLRTAAEYDNFRKRSAREQDAAFGGGVAHAVGKILTILDTLEMAEAAPTADENFKKGVTLTLEKAKAAFEALKVEEIPALGLPFDPAVHNAVMQKPAENGEESGTVLQVFQKGYKLGDKVIRHATVIVAE